MTRGHDVYALKTSTGYQLRATSVEAVTSALMQQLQKVEDHATFSWIVSTPHGTALTDTVDDEASRPIPAAARAEHAYGILVRDYLAHTHGSVSAR